MKNLPLHSRHEGLKAKFGEFAGYRMPLYYTKPIEEHHAVRQDAGVFDISHMGQFLITGDRAESMLDYLLTGNVVGLKDGQALYSPMCREDGGVLDDLIIYRHDAAHYRVIVNAGTRDRDFHWMAGVAEEHGVTVEDVSAGHCLLAVQGPKALDRLASHLTKPPGKLEYFHFHECDAFGVPAFVARTGYTGEPGCEIAVPVQQAEAVWQGLLEDAGLPPIGLAARDSLRQEACLPLYGHELRLDWHPLESGLRWAVELDGERDYIGKKALRAINGVGFPYRLVGLEVTGRGIPREEYPVLHDGQEVGRVTSGVLSPTTGKSVAQARVRIPHHKTGTTLQVEIRGKPVDAVVAARPFYKSEQLRRTAGTGAQGAAGKKKQGKGRHRVFR